MSTANASAPVVRDDVRGRFYDTNNNLVWFSHSVETESEENWTTVFSYLKDVSGFDSEGRFKIKDQEKGIEKVYRTVMVNAHHFLDTFHVKKNILP